MGCSQFSTKIVINSAVSKSQSTDLLLAESSKTMSGTSVISMLPSLKASQIFKPCLKVKICEPFSKFISNEIQNIDSVGKMMNKVRKYWILLTAFQNAFEKETHAICIDNYSVNDGLNVLFVVLALKSEGKLFQVSSGQLCFNFPKNAESLPVVASFKELSEFIREVVKKGISIKIEEYRKKFENLALETDKKKSACGKSALSAANEFLDNFKRIKEGISEFIRGFSKNKQRILALANEANLFGIQTVSQVVHFIIKKPYN